MCFWGVILLTVTGIQMSARNARASSSSVTGASNNEARRGMVLPFEPLSLAFNHVSYYVDMPAVSINAVINTTRKIGLLTSRVLVRIRK